MPPNTTQALHHVRSVTLIAFVAVAMVFTWGQAASANGTGGCANGDVCVWNQNQYNGCWRDMANDVSNYASRAYTNCQSLLLHNTVNSLKNRGTCKVRMSDYKNDMGPHITFRGRNQGGTIQDPQLGNGGGHSGSTGQNWANRISSHDFCP